MNKMSIISVSQFVNCSEKIMIELKDAFVRVRKGPPHNSFVLGI